MSISKHSGLRYLFCFGLIVGTTLNAGAQNPRAPGFHPLINGDFSTSDMNGWYPALDKEVGGTFPGLGVLDSVGDEILLDNTIYTSAPSSLKIIANDKSQTAGLNTNISSNPDIFWAYVDTTGNNLPDSTFTLTFKARWNKKGSLLICFNTQMWDTSSLANHGAAWWFGNKELESQITDTGWTSVSGTYNVNTDAPSPYSQVQGSSIKNAATTLVKGWPAVDGSGEWHVGLLFQASDSAVLWLDDMVLTYNGTSSKILNPSAFRNSFKGAKLSTNGKFVDFASPTSYRLSVLDPSGRVVSKSTGFGASALIPTDRIAWGRYIVNVRDLQNGADGSFVK